MLRVAAFTAGERDPSARFRVRQYIGPLSNEAVELAEYPASLGAYPPRNRAVRPFWAGATLAARLPGIAASWRHDVTLLQRQMLSTFVTLEPLTKRPRVLDVDDAIWLHRRSSAQTLARACDRIVCGNAYLADTFGKWNRDVVIIPTAVDVDRFSPGRAPDRPVIGWTGTSGNLRYVHGIEKALQAVLESVPDATLRIVCDAPPAFGGIPPSRIEYVRWSPDAEVDAIRGMSVGIMPLEDSEWARGKCSFKMLTYMACAVPVVVSPVGMNADVLRLGAAGLGARDVSDWVDALKEICSNSARASEMGAAGRQIVSDHYSTRAVVPQLARALRDTAAPGRSTRHR